MRPSFFRAVVAALAITLALALNVASGAAKKKKRDPDAEEATPAPRKKPAPEAEEAKGKKPPEDGDEAPKKRSAVEATPAKMRGNKPAPPAKRTPAPSDEEKAEAAPPNSSKPKATPTPAVPADATPAPVTPRPRFLPAATLATSDLLGFDAQPPRVQRLIEAALALTEKNITYTYGSADPANGGMDCSGAIYYLLRQQGLADVARDSAGQYVWARKHGQFFAVISKKAGGFEFADLAPGDLMFWSGTYSIDRDPPVTHTMIYLGVQRGRGQHVMWGSSDGRTYDGKPRNGVSVFDFKMPRTDSANGETARADFLGYARIPGLRE